VILTGFQVTSLSYNDTSAGNVFASGVNFKASATGQEYTVNVAKEVILSGGTIGSPQILQLSGIGPADTLKAAGVDQVIDLPVGYNLQDHTSNTMYWTTPEGTSTWGTLRDDKTVSDAAMAAYKAGDYANSQWTYVNEAIGYVALKDIMTNWAAFAQNATDFTGPSFSVLRSNLASSLTSRVLFQSTTSTAWQPSRSSTPLR
jgi:choline dehydrogenase